MGNDSDIRQQKEGGIICCATVISSHIGKWDVECSRCKPDNTRK